MSESIYDAIRRVGHDEDFVPVDAAEPTRLQPGTQERIDLMRRRAESGESLWHDEDLTCIDHAPQGMRIDHRIRYTVDRETYGPYEVFKPRGRPKKGGNSNAG